MNDASAQNQINELQEKHNELVKKVFDNRKRATTTCNAIIDTLNQHLTAHDKFAGKVEKLIVKPVTESYDEVIADCIGLVLNELKGEGDPKYVMARLSLIRAQNAINVLPISHDPDGHAAGTQKQFDEAKPLLQWTESMAETYFLFAFSSIHDEGSHFEYRVSKRGTNQRTVFTLSGDKEIISDTAQYYTLPEIKEHAERIERELIADAKKDFDDSADDGSEDEVKENRQDKIIHMTPTPLGAAITHIHNAIKSLSEDDIVKHYDSIAKISAIVLELQKD